MTKYDVLIVGCGLTACTIAAATDPRKTICIVDARPHVGGNCFDHDIGSSRVHAYGPHIFHSPDRRPVEFLSRFTAWQPYEHRVEAEIMDGTSTATVPFPYSKQTEQALGRRLRPHDVIDTFFAHYSKKMWGMSYDDLPGAIRGRVPKDTGETSSYFPGQFVGLPEDGYTAMAWRMLERGNVTIRLGVHPQAWRGIAADTIVYTGRPDLIDEDLQLLPWRSVDFIHNPECAVPVSAPVRNFCHMGTPFTRVTNMAHLTSTGATYCVAEIPRAGGTTELAPFYPDVARVRGRLPALVTRAVQARYPNMILAGRLGRFAYIDMHAAVSSALKIAEKL